jgi:hypothetical protein
VPGDFACTPFVDGAAALFAVPAFVVLGFVRRLAGTAFFGAAIGGFACFGAGR